MADKFNAAVSTKRKEQERNIENLHAKTFGAWVNHQLARKKFTGVSDVRKDFMDGVNLVHLVECLFEKIPKYNKEPASIHQRIENVGLALDVLKKHQGPKLQITPEDITDGNVKLTLGLLWRIISSGLLSIEDNDKSASERNKQAKGNLLSFCKKQTEGYEGVEINDFQKSFWDGLGFVALVNKLKPEAISYDDLKNADVKTRLAAAFDAAEKLGIPKLLDVEDMIKEDESQRPDEKCVMTYLSEFPLAFLQSTPVRRTKSEPEPEPEPILMPSRPSQEELDRAKEEIKKAQDNEESKKAAAADAQKKAEEARKQKEELIAKRKTMIDQKAALDAKEDTLKDKNKQMAEENKRLQDILDQLRKDNIRLKEEYAATKNALIGRLLVTINECKNLPGMNLGGKSADAYIKLKLDKQELKSKRAAPSLSPKFEQQFELYVTDKRSELEIQVMNWERIRTDKVIGHIVIPLENLTNADSKEETKWYPIHVDLSKKETLRKKKEEEKKGNSQEEKKEDKHDHAEHAEGKSTGEISVTIKFVLGN